MAKTIAIQGGYGAFHEIAAHHFFAEEEIEILPRNTFRDMVTTLKDRHCDFGIMAIENSLAGSIIPNYNLIINTSMHIRGNLPENKAEPGGHARSKNRRFERGVFPSHGHTSMPGFL